MDNIMNNPILVKLQEFGQKLGSNKFLSALQAGMMGSMAVIMVGAIATIICVVGPMLGLFENGSEIYKILYLPYTYTMDCITLWIVVGIGYNYAKQLKMKSPLLVAIDCLVVFMLVAGGQLVTTEAGGTAMSNSFFGATGMFASFIIVFVVVQIEHFCAVKNIRIKMPDVCPPSLQNSFNAILPLFFSVVIVYGANLAILLPTNGQLNLCSAIMAVLAAPLSALTSVPGMFVIGFFALLMWVFGIHGTMIVYSVLMASMMEATAYNVAAYQAGGIEALKFFPVALFGQLAIAGGTGNTLSLCLLGLRSKSEQIKAVSRIGLVPGWFGINEPVTFGMPIMYNPILAIPYILNPLLVMLLAYFAYQVGWLIPAFVPIYSLMPMGFASFLGTFRWQQAIWDYLMIIPSGLVWYPFLKVYEKQLVAQEAAAAAEAE